MKINADLTKRVVVHSDQLPWVDSPMAGVQRRMLERDGGEVARATTIVRYAPNSYFDFHTHDAGEEFIVLEGTFSDEMGDFPKGMYVRNPSGSRHKPHTRDGCVILVKLRQFQSGDDKFVRIDTHAAQWHSSNVPEVEFMPLHEFRSEKVVLEHWQPETELQSEKTCMGKEIYVLSGSFSDEHGDYPAGTWIRMPPDSNHTPKTKEGCLLYIKRGHLI